jgi:hypothetical protein
MPSAPFNLIWKLVAKGLLVAVADQVVVGSVSTTVAVGS